MGPPREDPGNDFLQTSGLHAQNHRPVLARDDRLRGMPLSLFQEIRDIPAEFDKDLLRRTFQNAEQPAIHFFGGEAGRHLKPFSAQLDFLYSFNCESALSIGAVGAPDEIQAVPIQYEDIRIDTVNLWLVGLWRLIVEHDWALLEQGSPESGQHFLLGGIISRGP